MAAQEQPIKLLVVEDDPGLQRQLRWSFEGCETAVASDHDSALAELARFTPAVVTLDLGLPPDPGGTSEGFRLLDEILVRAPDTKIIVVTGHNDRDNAVRAVGRGAYDFFEKPIDPDLLGMMIERAAKLARLEQDYRKLASTVPASPFGELIAVSPQMLEVCRTVEKLAPTDVTTLILGESGTGKEVLVRILHSLSARSGRRLVAINCAAIPDALLESELFGYEKGAFTGAVKTTRGKIETADRGILFLDEIGDLPLSLQAKLLRFLQERVIERIGGRQEIPVDVRVVCATHQNLPKLIEEGRFREDLYYRINEATIQVPPLRERRDDAVVLARAFLNRFAAQHRKPVKSFARQALAMIEAYAWPGNVRELENRVKRAVVMADGREITAEDLELAQVEARETPFNLREVRELSEMQAITRAIHHSDRNLSRAAELLGITRPTLYNLMKKYSIPN
ncbi:MAG: PEP-CTERM-box response regulator transcription factor [Thiohalocapsa sp.]|uniref:PEP-CTERM-box response regulator transcription factor n=1 Tax=Thiohalocapsa sp. TaxID=2497641 RepID=UPI0025E910CB|nr:PEP-CTERM-box response regulator transcription factor [Thiohalocapsa sp.]MCG6940178.1 PEP-CTERM-box response regulator transcription factor [Thiohalocapsa sp.]